MKIKPLVQKIVRTPRISRALGVPLRKSMSEVVRFTKSLGFFPKTIVDVGVNTGTEDLYEPFSSADILLIEPLSENEIFLKDIVSRYPGAQYVVAAAGSENSTVEISVSPCFGGSSIMDQRASEGFTKRSIPVVTVDELVHQRKLTGPFLIKSDTQGYEHQVLSGAKETLKDTELVLLESRLFPYQGSPEMGETVQFMADFGFVLFDMFDLIYRPSDGTLGQIDLAFVKKNGFFRNEKSYRSAPGFRTDTQRKTNWKKKLEVRQRELDRVLARHPDWKPQQ